MNQDNISEFVREHVDPNKLEGHQLLHIAHILAEVDDFGAAMFFAGRSLNRAAESLKIIKNQCIPLDYINRVYDYMDMSMRLLTACQQLAIPEHRQDYDQLMAKFPYDVLSFHDAPQG